LNTHFSPRVKLLGILAVLLSSALIAVSVEEPESKEKWVTPAAEARKKRQERAMGQMRLIWAFILPNSPMRRCRNKQTASSFGKLRSARNRCPIIALGFRPPIAGT